jgi:hypothetical protein
MAMPPFGHIVVPAQWQLAHDVAEQVPQLDFPVPEVLKSPAALLKLQHDMSLSTSPPHCGQITCS